MRVTRSALILCALVAALSSPTAALTVNTQQTFQTIDGFGFFGPNTAWWNSSDSNRFWSNAWLDVVIDTLGTTIWRDEYYSIESFGQDATWPKQRATVRALHNRARGRGNPLKFILTVWSPPGALKCEGTGGCWGSPTTIPWVNPSSDATTRGGGTLCEAKHTEFAQWLVQGVRNYESLGASVYALSFQNEPLFCQSYNACFYEYDYYWQTLADIGPIVKAACPSLKFFGAEHMLSANINDGKTQFPWLYESRIIDNSRAAPYLDIWAYHGYSDGVSPVPGSEMAQLWELVRTSLTRNGAHKPIWQTEISGYTQAWAAGGAMELAAAIMSGLKYGDMAGWVHWYGAGNLISETDNRLTKQGYVHKHFSRFIRPGAVRVQVEDPADNNLHLVAFKHDALRNFVVVAMNTGDVAKSVALSGTGVPSRLAVYRTSATENCAFIDSASSSSISIPARSLVTLVSGSVVEGNVVDVGGKAQMRTVTVAGAGKGDARSYALNGRRLATSLSLAGQNGRGVTVSATCTTARLIVQQ